MILFIFRCRPQQMRLPWLSRGSRRWRPAWCARPAWWRQHTEPRWRSCQLCPPEGRRLGTWGLRWCTQCCRRGRVKHWTLPDSFVNCGARRKKHPPKKSQSFRIPKRSQDMKMLSVQGNSDILRALGVTAQQVFPCWVLLLWGFATSQIHPQTTKTEFL